MLCKPNIESSNPKRAWNFIMDFSVLCSFENFLWFFCMGFLKFSFKMMVFRAQLHGNFSRTPLAVFLVGAFSFKEKSPTITAASFFSFFFVRPQSSSRMYHFLQKLIRLLRPSQANGNLVQRVPPSFFTFLRNLQNRKRPKGPPFNFFSGLCEIFFENFLRSQKCPPFEFFDILQQNVC